jgi:hypothetical protein
MLDLDMSQLSHWQRSSLVSDSPYLVKTPPSGLYRAGRWSDVDSYPPPSKPMSLKQPILDGPRWEDMAGEFATISCFATPEAAIGQAISRFRHRHTDPARKQGLIDAILAFLDSEPDPDRDFQLTEGHVPDAVFDDLYLIHIPEEPDVCFVDLRHTDTINVLQRYLAPALRDVCAEPLGTEFSDARDRRVTRLITTVLHSVSQSGLLGPVGGLRLPSDLDPAWDQFIVWSPPRFVDLSDDGVSMRWVAASDQDAVRAADRLGLVLPSA